MTVNPDSRWWVLMLMAVSPLWSQPPTEEVTRWSSYNHPLSYQGRTLTRDLAGNYFAVIRTGASINVWKRSGVGAAWTNLGAVNATPLSGREGDCASIATDGKGAIHVAYYDGASPDLAHRSSADGKTFGPQRVILRDVSWEETGPGSPFLHVDRSNGLHVAFSDEADDRPHYAYSSDEGATWKTTKVADLFFNMLRPSVVTLPGGRVVYGFSNPRFRGYYSDDKGATWKESSPSTTTVTSIYNCRLIANGNDVYVVGQKTNPDPRGVVLSQANGTTMAWQPWETVSEGTGADPSAFVAADGKVHVIYRVYPDSPRLVYRAWRDQGAWKTQPLSAGSDDFIFTYAYWQEFHRGNPADNRASYLAPNTTSNRIYFGQVTGASYPQDADVGIFKRHAPASFPGQDRSAEPAQYNAAGRTWDPAVAGHGAGYYFSTGDRENPIHGSGGRDVSGTSRP